LKNNKIKFKDNTVVNPNDLLETTKQKPNRKLLGLFPFYLWAYNIPNPDKFDERNEKRLAKYQKKNAKRAKKGKKPAEYKPAGSWWRETVGEPPVIFDSLAMEKSTEQIRMYLVKHGWFNAEVSAAVAQSRLKKTKVVTYIVKGNEPYTIREINYDIPDSLLIMYTNASRGQRKDLIKGQQFNIDKLNEEREKLNNNFRNQGYYNFNKELIYFDVDTNLNQHALDLTLGIVPRRVPFEGNPDSLLVVPYKRYKINSITIIDFPKSRNTEITKLDSSYVRDYLVIDQDQLKVKPKVLGQNILFNSKDYYELDKVTRTYRRLSSLPIVQSARVQFSPVSEDINNNELNCTIGLTPSKKQNVAFEWKGTNRAGYLGVAGKVGYINKNIFGGAELFNFNITGGIEAQQLLTSSEDATTDGSLGSNLYFNTIEFGPEISITFPRFLLPVKVERFSKSANPQTAFTANLSYQRRPDYTRTRSFGSIAYLWAESEEKKWSISPLEVSVIKIDRSLEFDQQLEEIGDPFLTNSFQDHFIVDTRVTYTLNTRDSGQRKRNFFFYHTEFESAGNLLRGIFDLANATPDENDSYQMLGIRFAQYVKTVQDLRYYRMHNPKMSTVYRLAGGIGIPLKNFYSLPFEKSFFGGGANDIRAWQARTLGPGSYLDPDRSFDKIGDIMIEANVEYRFNLIDILESALFIDAGNIWTLRADEARPGADFEFNRFLGEIAFGVGTGLRLNFDFFLIRLDLALQVKDPALPKGERWLFQPKEKYNEYIDNVNETRPPDSQISTYKWRWNLNIGIGYPF
jgi:outer membrane protein assembly factor BamA